MIMGEQAIAVTAIIGLIEAVKSQVPQVKGLVTVGLSLALGVILGVLGYLGVTGVEQGLLVGLSAIGINVAAKRIGGN